MDKKKICKIAGVAAAGIVFAVGGIYVGSQQTHTADRYPALSNVVTTAHPMTANKLSTLEGEQHAITLHFKWEGAQPHIAYKVDETGVVTTTPGVPMRDEGNGWYTYTISDAEVANMVISIPELDYTTSDFNRSEGEYWYDQDTGWYTSEPAIYEKSADAAITKNEETEVVEDIADVAAGSKITVHFPSSMSDANIYAWNALPEDIEMDWPGDSLEDEEDGYYSYTFSKDVTKVNFLFNNDTEQTEDFRIVGAGEYWYSDGKWVNKKPDQVEDPDVTEAPEQTEKPEESDPNATPRPASTPVVDPNASDDFRDESIYFMITTRFYDGDSSNNSWCDEDEKAGNKKNNDPAWRGDFKGLIEKLDYLKALGFSAVWITPVVENRSGYDYHGYHAYDFSRVDPRYESSDVGYQELINAAHKKGIKIIQDVVFNHSCNWGEKNLKRIDNPVYAGGRSDMTTANGAKDDPENIYHHKGFCGGGDWDNYNCQVMTMADDCFDLETENPKVYNYLIDCYQKYIKMGVDAFRVDTVKHISRLTLNARFLPAMMEAGGKNFYMFGEVCTKGSNTWYREQPGISTCFYTWDNDAEWISKWSDSDLSTNESLVEAHYNSQNMGSQPKSDNAFLQGNTYHTPDYSEKSDLSVIDFQMHWDFINASKAFGRAKEEDPYFNDSTWNVVYVDSHDYAPDEQQTLRYAGGTEAWAENMNLMWTFRGIPCIYYGSEVEFQAGKPIDKGATAALADTGRAYFGDYLEGEVSASDYGEYTASGKVAETLNSPLSQQLIRLNKIRRAVPALRRGQYSTEGCNGNIAFKRRYTANGEDSFVCVTISDSATFSGIPGGTYVDLITGDQKTVSEGGSLSASCSGKGNMRVYVLQNDTAKKYGADGKLGKDTDYLK